MTPDAIDASTPAHALQRFPQRQVATSRRMRREQQGVIPHQLQELARAAKVGHGAALRA